MKYIVLFHLTGKRNQREFMYCGQSHIARKIVRLKFYLFWLTLKLPVHTLRKSGLISGVLLTF